MIGPDGRAVHHDLRIAAPASTVWKFWTDPQRMSLWWGRAAELDVRPGGACVVHLGDGAVMRGEYVELVPYERIIFTFGWDDHTDGPDVPPASTRVEITLVEDDGDTIVTLRHTGLPDGVLAQHDDGWGYFLAELAGTVAAAT